MLPKKGNLERVRLLVEQGLDKDEGDNFGYTPLFWVSWTGHLNVVQYLVEQGASLDKASTKGWTPLAGAASEGHIEISRYLLEQQGADRDKADTYGVTPFHNAAHHGHLETAMLLMSYGADLNARTNDGWLPIDCARTGEIKQAIRDEPRRRMDEAPGKRATEQDQHPDSHISFHTTGGRSRGRAGAEQQTTTSRRGSCSSSRGGDQGR